MPLVGNGEWEFGLCECLGVGKDIGGAGGEVVELRKRGRCKAIGVVSCRGGPPNHRKPCATHTDDELPACPSRCSAVSGRSAHAWWPSASATS